jgi:hypothetical protein
MLHPASDISLIFLCYWCTTRDRCIDSTLVLNSTAMSIPPLHNTLCNSGEILTCSINLRYSKGGQKVEKPFWLPSPCLMQVFRRYRCCTLPHHDRRLLSRQRPYHWHHPFTALLLLYVHCFASCRIEITTDNAVSKSRRTSYMLQHVVSRDPSLKYASVPRG